MSLLDGRECSATVRATKDLAYYKIDKQQFLILRANLKPAPYKVIRYLKNVIERLRQMNAKIEAFYADPKTSLKEMKKGKTPLWKNGADDRIGAGSRTTQAGTRCAGHSENT